MFLSVTMDDVQFIGLRQLDEDQQSEVRGLVGEYQKKILRKFKDATLAVHVKLYSKGGRPKYAIHVKAISGKILFESSHGHDYDLAKSFHMAFNDILKQILHSYRSDVTRKKPYD